MDETSSPQRFLDRFPDEILLQILELASQCNGERGILNLMNRPSGPLETGRLPFDQICYSWNGVNIRSSINYPNGMNLALVSRRLYRTMLPIFYHTVVLTTESQLRSFVLLVWKRPDLAALVKVLGVQSLYWTGGADVSPGPLIRKVYLGCPNLIAFDDYSSHGMMQHLPLPISPDGVRALYPRLQYLFASHILTVHPWFILPRRLDPPLFFTHLSSYSELRFLSLAFEVEQLGIETPKLSLPHLEVLSLTIGEGYSPEVDAYFARAELPKFHALHITLIRKFNNRPTINPFQSVHELLKGHGNKLLTIKVTNQATGDGHQVVTFKLPEYLPNIQQFIINEESPLQLLHDTAHCTSLQTLEITTISPGSWTYGVRLRHLLIDNPLRHFGFENVRTIQLSLIPSHSSLSREEDVRISMLGRLSGFIEAHTELFRSQGIQMVLKIDAEP